MAALTSLFIGAALALGAGAAYKNFEQTAKQNKKDKRALEQQRIEAENAAALEKTRTKTGAKVKLGSVDKDKQAQSRKAAGAQRSGVTNVGGLGASSKLGL